MSTKNLNGLRVLDLSRMVSGPYCTMHLADHGAEVINIESGGSDTNRGNGPFRDDDLTQEWSGYSVDLNRGKKSIRLDLESADGKASFRKLAATADVIVENFRPGLIERLGLSYASLAADNPKLVYAAIRGKDDPRSGACPSERLPSYDVVTKAVGELTASPSPDADTPTKTDADIGDVFAGMMMAFSIMAALREAESTGKGQFVDVAVADTMISLCEPIVHLHDLTGAVPDPDEGNGALFPAPFGLFPVKDGHIALGIVEDVFWRRLVTLMDQSDLSDDPRFATSAARSANAADLNAAVADWSGRHNIAGLTALLGGEVPYGVKNTVADIIRDPHVQTRGVSAKVPGPATDENPWAVATNPLRSSAHDQSGFTTPPASGAHGDLLKTNDVTSEMHPDAKRALRNAFGNFATGVTVVTTRQPDGTPRGFTANSFTSVSLDPPLLLVCIAKAANSCEVFAQADHFAVNILADNQKEVSGLFASQSVDKFDLAEWRVDDQNVPLIDGTLASFSCARHQLVDAGDHLILIGQVLDFETAEGTPLGYYKGAYFDIGHEQALVDAAASADGVSLAAVLTCDKEILLQLDASGRVSLPSGPGKTNSIGGLSDYLQSLGLEPALDYLYAVYQNTQNGTQRIVYHGTVTGNAPNGMRYFLLDALPLERIADKAEHSLLRRYVRENRYGAFGIYHGTEIEGVVHTVAGQRKYHI